MIIACRNPACGQRLKLPDDQRGILRVRCPRCKTMFDWSLPGSKFEIREVALRCAVTGLKSNAVFIRDRPTDKFRLRLVDPRNASVVERGVAWKAAERERARAEEESQTKRIGRGWLALAFRNAEQKLENWADRFVAAAEGSARQVTIAATPARSDADACFNSDEFDWAGMWCPHCKEQGNARWQIDGRVIQCGSCHEIACSGRLVDLPSGAQTFRCHDGCIGAGQLVTKEFDVSGKGMTVDPAERDRLLRRPAAIAGEKRKELEREHREALAPPPRRLTVVKLEGRQS
jgi:phage FluMu protein Com